MALLKKGQIFFTNLKPSSALASVPSYSLFPHSHLQLLAFRSHFVASVNNCAQQVSL